MRKKKESITNRVAKVQLREVQGVGIQKKKCLLYTRTIMMLITNISLNFNSYVLDLARFEDPTFAFFKGKC